MKGYSFELDRSTKVSSLYLLYYSIIWSTFFFEPPNIGAYSFERDRSWD